jgi:hypothetical protein
LSGSRVTASAEADRKANPLEVALFAQSIHEYIREYIRLADQKSAFVFGGSTAGLAFLYQSSKTPVWIAHIGDWSLGRCIALLAMAVLASAGGTAIVAVSPRRRGSRSGLIFWDAILERSSWLDYASDLLGSSEEDLLREKIKHTYELAGVCRAKYDWLRRSFRLLLTGLVLVS